MANRRVPLSNIPNVINSPRRVASMAAAAAGTTSKRSRSHSSVQDESAYADAPPAKKQMYLADYVDPPRTPSRPRQVPVADAHGFPRKTADSHLTTLDRKLMAARDKQRASMEEKAISENLENVRQWQKHYRRAFPHFVFYFESIPEEVRVKCSRQISSLGAREVKFFSKSVTHVVTTRSIPPDSKTATSSGLEAQTSSNAAGMRGIREPLRTINPSLLERPSDGAANQVSTIPPNGRFTFESSSLPGVKLQKNGQAESKRPPAGSVDVLCKAREMGMKIWALEKLQRMMTAMFETDTGPYPTHEHNTRSQATNPSVARAKPNREAQLSQLLREERLNGPADRDPSVTAKELIPFKGPFIYVHDIDEKVKPILVRDYPKVAKREDGAWPQFRSVSHGKCPFVEEVEYVKRERAPHKGHEEDREERQVEAPVAPRTRAAVASNAAKMQPPYRAADRDDGSVEVYDEAEPTDEDPDGAQVPSDGQPAKAVFACQEEDPERPLRQEVPASHRMRMARFIKGEPVASGVQPSNITSAIRSQMISSTAAAPGAKAGTNKELYGLKRKLLEKHNAPATNAIPSRPVAEISGNAQRVRGNTNPRVAKLRAQQKLGHMDEEVARLDEDEDESRQLGAAGPPAPKKHVVKKDPKPGYCENCRDKFDDFDEHIVSRNHRRFALAERNWTDLDALLQKLVRPLKGSQVFSD